MLDVMTQIDFTERLLFEQSGGVKSDWGWDNIKTLLYYRWAKEAVKHASNDAVQIKKDAAKNFKSTMVKIKRQKGR